MAGQQETDKSGLKNKRLKKIRRDKEKADRETGGKQTDGAAVTPHLTLELTEVMSTIYHTLLHTHTPLVFFVYPAEHSRMML